MISSRSGRILILGGTTEGRALAAALSIDRHPVISSLAGRVTAPTLPPGEVRIGGFGGPVGLAKFLDLQGIRAVIDATHPFAARISANAVAATEATGTPLLRLRRAPWTAVSGDRWTAVSDLPAAAAALLPQPRDSAVLLTVGRQGVQVFSALPQRFWLRAVDPPQPPLPARVQVLLDRGPFTLPAERQLLRRLAIDVLVTKNSGGPMTAAKLVAARELDLPVIMIDRPPTPAGIASVGDVPSALAWLGARTDLRD